MNFNFSLSRGCALMNRASLSEKKTTFYCQADSRGLKFSPWLIGAVTARKRSKLYSRSTAILRSEIFVLSNARICKITWFFSGLYISDKFYKFFFKSLSANYFVYKHSFIKTFDIFIFVPKKNQFLWTTKDWFVIDRPTTATTQWRGRNIIMFLATVTPTINDDSRRW